MTQEDDSMNYSSTACSEFPPRDCANSKNSQHRLNMVVSEHPERDIGMATSATPTYCVENDACFREPHQSRNDNSRSSAPHLMEELEDTEAEGEGSSEMARLLPPSPPPVANDSCEVITVQRRVFDVSSLPGSIHRAVCPIRPKLDVCLLVR